MSDLGGDSTPVGAAWLRRPILGGAQWLAPSLWTLYVALPARGWGLLAGIPLDAVAAVALSGIWLAWACRTRPWRWRVAAALLAVKTVAGPVAFADRGMAAEYFANDSVRPPLERSIEFSRGAFTRIDCVLAFGPGADADLPLFFLNDLGRFNYYKPDEPTRAALPYSVVWTGRLLVDRDAIATAFARGHGVRAEVAIDGINVAALRPDERDARGTATLRRGWQNLRVTVMAPYGADRAFSAGLIDSSGRERPFSDANVFVQRLPAWRLWTDRAARLCSLALDVAWLAWLTFRVLTAIVTAIARPSARSLTMLLAAAMLADAFVFAWPWAGRLMLLEGGSDPLSYEFHARGILLYGPLMTHGQPVGQGEAFYYQPLYPYVLALLHRVFGESVYGIVLVQRLLVAGSAALIWRITHALFGARIGVAGLGLALVFVYVKVGPWAAVLLGEVVFIPLVCLWTRWSIALAERDDRRTWLASGLSGGLATLGRSTLLLAWPPVFALIVAIRRRARRALAPVAVAFALTIAVVGMATLRNWIVARRFVPVTTSFSINFYLGNQPPAWFTAHTVDEHALYKWIAREDTTRMALDFAVHQPALFARNLVNKALYTLGFFGAFVPGAATVPALVVVWIVAAAGVVVLAVRGVADGRPGLARAVPGAIAASHFASVVIIFPHVYVDRLILPFYVLILPYAAVALSALVPGGLSSLNKDH